MSEDYLNTRVSLDDFRKLIGLPSEPLPAPAHRLPRWFLSIERVTQDPKNNIGIYENIICEEHRSSRKARAYDILVYGGLIGQLIISALLILLAATPSDHHISLAVLSAFNGVATGILALVRGQGLPTRLLEYSDGLRRVRERIEWVERELETGKREVRYSEVVALKELYERIREDEQKNRPGSWTPSGRSIGSSSGGGAASRSSLV
ncbi:hypothetical protein BU16DRAFT_523943 [Lophium mytilinum]|uniref:SMODS and SLOG-associating 2TM effector domain-containing protein n=1 Tax=Lophium mytilinum TaxID=390894 RepID=A0A6A6R501_9PEZI|nr:hypothetical protein BU16DRAFT_523943 [Lophium mytilinum]